MNTRTRSRAVQTPGAPAADTSADLVGDSETVQAGGAAQGSQEGETVAVPKAQLDALMARLEALENAPAQAAARRANPEAHLPDQSEIDPKKIKSPQLSKQGWVVPETFGAPPANSKAL